MGEKKQDSSITQSPSSEPTEEEIAEALRIMGEKCICPTLMGTALYMGGSITVDCPIHGELAHSGVAPIDISKWQTPLQPGDIVTVVAESMANKVDIDIMGKFEGTVTYGTEEELTNLADDYEDWEDANPPRQSKSAAPKHTEDGRSVFTSVREIGKRAREVLRKRA